MGFTFLNLAATERVLGVSTEHTFSDAEKAYSTVARFLSDPRHVRHITETELDELTQELNRLRNALDNFESLP